MMQVITSWRECVLLGFFTKRWSCGDVAPGRFGMCILVLVRFLGLGAGFKWASFAFLVCISFCNDSLGYYHPGSGYQPVWWFTDALLELEMLDLERTLEPWNVRCPRVARGQKKSKLITSPNPKTSRYSGLGLYYPMPQLKKDRWLSPTLRAHLQHPVAAAQRGSP